MSLQLILMNGPKAGQMHALSEQRAWHEGDTISFPVWPPMPMNSQEAFEDWPTVPKWTETYQIEALPQATVPGTAVYVGRRP